MKRLDFARFARDWQAAWNSHDLDRILAHYHPDIRFSSRKADALTGTGVVEGKPALEAYWRQALTLQPELFFEIEDIFEGHRMMVITYRNHRKVLAAETLQFDEDGLVIRASACHREG